MGNYGEYPTFFQQPALHTQTHQLSPPPPPPPPQHHLLRAAVWEEKGWVVQFALFVLPPSLLPLLPKPSVIGSHGKERGGGWRVFFLSCVFVSRFLG